MAETGSEAIGAVTLTRRRFNCRLLRWHRDAERSLAIRDATTPWEILVAEVMSQQTGVERIGGPWRAFVQRWPTPAALSNASTRDLLEAWAGLGYNRRALALRNAARSIVQSWGGSVPTTVEGLEGLSGIGRYTARAVAAAAFGVPVAPLDVNVGRVLSRVLGGALSLVEIQAAGDGLVARSRPRQWVNAVMDLAATICSARAPRCEICPLVGLCATQGEEPVKPRTPTAPFASTSRWLRGRLIAAFLEAPGQAWVALPKRLGEHNGEAIRIAARSLEQERFIDLRDGLARLRSDE
jgi:A/G-specific adenine glycosylase